MSHKIIRGSIKYTSRKPERLGQERGREYFTLTQQPDGIDVMMAHCEIDDAPKVVRDVCLAMNHVDSSPIDCSVRLSVGGRFEGSGWMRFGKGYAECETMNARDGRLSQRVETDAHVGWLQAHPIVGDALLMRLYPISQGPGVHHVSNIYLTSPDHRGATGPLLFQTEFDLIFVGLERISVEAGEFDAHHFQLSGTAGNLPEEHPPYDVWCTADDDYILLKASGGGYMQTHYELTELRIESSP